MPKYNSIVTFVADNPPSHSLPLSKTRKAWHKLFCFFQTQRSAENFACWTAMHQYKQHQRKRFAVFISENWLDKPASTAFSIFAATNSSLFEVINFSSAISADPASAMKISWMKMVMTRDDKAGYTKDQIKFLGFTPPDLFDKQYVELGNLLTGMMYNSFDSDPEIMAGGAYQANLPGELAMMKASGFDLHKYGMW